MQRKIYIFRRYGTMKEMFKKGFSFTMGMYAAHIAAACVLNIIAKSKTTETSTKEESKAEEES